MISASIFCENFEIDAEVKNGTAWLKGAVQSEEESALAEQIAKNADDTRKVNNRLQVKTQKSG